MGDNGADIVKALKPPTTIGQQLALLQERGLVISDVARAERFLQGVSYYRFTAYLLAFKDGDCYRQGTEFERICRI